MQGTQETVTLNGTLEKSNIDYSRGKLAACGVRPVAVAQIALGVYASIRDAIARRALRPPVQSRFKVCCISCGSRVPFPRGNWLRFSAAYVSPPHSGPRPTQRPAGPVRASRRPTLHEPQLPFLAGWQPIGTPLRSTIGKFRRAPQPRRSRP